MVGQERIITLQSFQPRKKRKEQGGKDGQGREKKRKGRGMNRREGLERDK